MKFIYLTDSLMLTGKVQIDDKTKRGLFRARSSVYDPFGIMAADVHSLIGVKRNFIHIYVGNRVGEILYVLSRGVPFTDTLHAGHLRITGRRDTRSYRFIPTFRSQELVYAKKLDSKV